MGLFDIFKRKKVKNDDSVTYQMSVPYESEPKFFKKDDGTVYGVLPLVEDTHTVLPANPTEMYLDAANGEKITEWKLAILSTTEDKVILKMEYYKALEKLEPYIMLRHEGNIIVDAIEYSELKKLEK